MALAALTACDGDETTDGGAFDAGAGGDAGASDAGGRDAESLDGGNDGGRADGGSADGGPADGGDADAGCAPGAACGPAAINVAFVTSTTQVAGALGGTASADAICNVRAAAAGLSGTYVAWLSSDTSDAITRLGTASGWVRTDGRPFAASVEDLTAARLLHPLEIDETGAAVDLTASPGAVTGTSQAGVSQGSDCTGWTGATGQGAGGRVNSSRRDWTTGNLFDCTDATRLYCLGVDHVSPYTVSPVPGRVAFVSQGLLGPDAGRAAADALCATEASAAGLTGTFHALLASTTASAISMFTTTGLPWVRVDGVALTDTASDLATGGSLSTPIVLQADGNVSNQNIVWTGAPSVDAVATENCADWSSSSGGDRAYVGRLDEGQANAWFGSSTVPCTFSDLPVYCFEE